MLIRGERMTGKTLLIDLLKQLYMLPDHDEDPRTDYQMRVLLAKTTVPALIPECVRACTDDKLLSLWKESATVINLVFAGGAYRGFYYALRSIIAATNERIDIPTDLADKVLVVDIDAEDGVDLNKCRGCTPLTMDASTRGGVKMLGYVILQKLANRLEEIKKLSGLDRREVLRGLIRVGYDLWCDVFKDYGLDPFTSPFVENMVLVTEEEQFAEEERARFSELVEEFIRWYAEEKEKEVKAECAYRDEGIMKEYCEYVSNLIEMFKRSPEKHYVCYIDKNTRACDKKDAEAFDRFGLIKVFDGDNNRLYVVMNMSVFNRFVKFLKREYRMNDREVERVKMALVAKLTTICFEGDRDGEPIKKKVYKIVLC
jgi:hypothetical protein